MRRTGKKLIWKWYVISTRSYLYISFCNLKRKLFTKGKISSNWRECVAHYYYQLEGIYVKWWTGLHNFFDGCSRQSSSQFGSEVFPPFGRIWYSTRLYSMQCAACPHNAPKNINFIQNPKILIYVYTYVKFKCFFG